MNFKSYIDQNAILDIDQLHSLENCPLWIVILASFNSQDYHSVKIPWIHDGIFDQNGIKFNNDYDDNKIYLCRNKENHHEYIAVYDFIKNPILGGDINVLFSSEDLADGLINSTIIMRSWTNPKIQSMLDDILINRSFAIRDRNNYSIFEMLSAKNNDIEIYLNIIPK